MAVPMPMFPQVLSPIRSKGQSLKGSMFVQFKRVPKINQTNKDPICTNYIYTSWKLHIIPLVGFIHLHFRIYIFRKGPFQHRIGHLYARMVIKSDACERAPHGCADVHLGEATALYCEPGQEVIGCAA